MHGSFLNFCVLPHAALGFDDPVGFTFRGQLHNHPVGMIEADRAARFQVIAPGLGARFPLFGRAKAGEPHNVLGVIKDFREYAYIIVVGRDKVEDSSLGDQRREIAPPTERFGFR